MIAICACRFFVDDIPIRRYPRKSENTFPMRPMWMYGTIWDASSWATDRGKYRVDYRYQPFVARFTRFIIRGCSAYAPSSCRQAPSSQSGSGLSPQQYAAMQWAQSNYMVYNYCMDPKRDHALTPECWGWISCRTAKLVDSKWAALLSLLPVVVLVEDKCFSSWLRWKSLVFFLCLSSPKGTNMMVEIAMVVGVYYSFAIFICIMK